MLPTVSPARAAPRAADVRIEDSFWGPRLDRLLTDTLPQIHDRLEATHRFAALRWAAEGRAPEGAPRPGVADDSDIAKWVEAASRIAARTGDRRLTEQVETVVGAIVAAQQPDGYLNSSVTVFRPQTRWAELRDGHEMYTLGHLIEAGVTHHEATGSTRLLDAACRMADHLEATFGDGEGRRRGFCGHPEIELALFRLARATGERRYADLGRWFVEGRGDPPDFFEREDRERGRPGMADAYLAEHGLTGRTLREYNQSHAPIREQADAVGHAVRALYLYSGATDVALAYGDAELFAACERLWESVQRQMYVTGGVGSSAANEGFSGDFDLPNETAYAETCAAVALVMWARRMLDGRLDRRFGDVMERALYNGALAGISLDGRAFFYENPLASGGDRQREPWFACPCCPPNIARLLASLGEYVYGVDARGPIVHLFVGGSAAFDTEAGRLTLEQTTDVPWAGSVALTVRTPGGASLRSAIRVRLPEWATDPAFTLGREPIQPDSTVRGYAEFDRDWQDGDVLSLDLPMPVLRMHAHPAVLADRGRVALQRGPLVYAFEQHDVPVPIDTLVVPPGAAVATEFQPELLGGVVAIDVGAATATPAGSDTATYRAEAATAPIPVRAIPYFAWANRGPAAMAVWVAECIA